MAEQINTQPPWRVPHVEHVVTEGGRGQPLLNQLHRLPLLKQMRQLLDFIKTRHVQVLKAIPHVSLIKTEDVISDEHIHVLLHHQVEPGKKHFTFPFTHMDNSPRDIGTPI